MILTESFVDIDTVTLAGSVGVPVNLLKMSRERSPGDAWLPLEDVRNT
jgi:hypothetical protein